MISLCVIFCYVDDKTAAHCAVLFERPAENYLDMECLAMVGMLFFELLKRAADGPVQSDYPFFLSQLRDRCNLRLRLLAEAGKLAE